MPIESAERLSSATNVTIKFFDRDPSVRHLGFHRLYRLQRKVGVRSLEMLESDLNARRLHILKILKKFDVRPTLQLPERADFEGYTPVMAAQMLRRSWMVKRGVIGPITPLLEAAGIFVVEVDLPEKSFEGLAVRAFDAYPLIFVRKGQTADRRRYTLAHELAHLILHQESVEEQETEANAFAGEWLFPEEFAVPALSNFSIARALELKAKYQLSIQFFIMRAAQLELISKEEKARHFKYISMKGWKTEEPYAEAPERPQMLSRLLRSLLDQLSYTVEEIAGELGESPDRIRSYFFEDDISRKLRLV